jgi:hypothetical protein
MRTICKRLLICHEVLQLQKANITSNSMVAAYKLYLPGCGHQFLGNVLDQGHCQNRRIWVHMRQSFNLARQSLKVLNKDCNHHSCPMLSC